MVKGGANKLNKRHNSNDCHQPPDRLKFFMWFFVCLGGMWMRKFVFLLILFSVTPMRVKIASVGYVDNAGATKVDTASTAN